MLPDPLYGMISINAGAGVDKFFADSSVTPILGMQPGFNVSED